MISAHVKNIVFLHVQKYDFSQWRKTLYHTNVYEITIYSTPYICMAKVRVGKNISLDHHFFCEVLTVQKSIFKLFNNAIQ